MSAILEAVREEIAKVEEEYEAVMRPLREIEALALKLNGDHEHDFAGPDMVCSVCGHEPSDAELAEYHKESLVLPPPAAEKSAGDRALEAAKEQRASRTRATQKRFTDDQIEAAAAEVVKHGHATPNKVVQHLGTKSTPVRRRVEEIFARWEGDGRIVADAPVRGHASFKLAEESEPSPEPPAPAPEQGDAGAAQAEGQAAASDFGASDEEAKEEVEDFGLVDDDTTEQVVDEIDGYAPARKGQGEQISSDYRPLADRIVEAATLEPKTTVEIAEILQMTGREDLKTIRRLTEKLVRMGELQQRGYGKDSRPRYRATPSLEDRGVTVRQADRESPLETQVLAAIDQDGALSVTQLAAKTVRHPRDVAAAVTALIERREVKKTRSHPDAVYERQATAV